MPNEEGDRSAMRDERTPSPASSRMSLPPTLSPAHKIRLVLYHTLALTPSVIILCITLWSTKAVMNVCNMRLLFPELVSENCSPVMTRSIAVMVFTIGIVCWYASFKLRPLFWEVVFVVLKVMGFLLSILLQNAQFNAVSPMLLSTLMALCRTLVVESLRIVSYEASTLILIALAWNEYGHLQPESFDAEPKCWTGVDDPRFILTLWLGCGWAFAEVLAGSYQLYKFVPMYRTTDRPMLGLGEEDLLTDFIDAAEEEQDEGSSSYLSSGRSSDQLEGMSLDELILMREKTELEDQLGEYLENVPPAIITLWRLDSVLWQLGTCLLISAAIVQAQGCASLDGNTTYRFLPFPPLHSMRWTFAIIVIIHTISVLAWLLVLPRLGLTNVTYSSLLVGLVLLSSGLGRWNVLK